MASGPSIANCGAAKAPPSGAAAAPAGAESEQLPSHLPDLGLRDYAGSELAQELRDRQARRAELAGPRARIAELPVDQLWEIPCRCARDRRRSGRPPVLTAPPALALAPPLTPPLRPQAADDLLGARLLAPLAARGAPPRARRGPLPLQGL